MKILNINKNYNDTIPKKTFQYILNTYSYGLSKNIWRNYSIQTHDTNFKKTKITFYKSNFSFPIIKIVYSKKFDKEIFEIGKPFWENLVRSSNLKDYGGFTRDFSTQMLFGANEVELGKQWANNKIITNLKETFEPFGCLRRGVHITVLIKQTNKEISGEFLGRLVLGVEDDVVKVFGATIY